VGATSIHHSDVKVFGVSAEELEICDTVAPGRRFSSRTYPYSAKSWVPAGSWRALASDEERKVIAPKGDVFQAARSIGLVRPPSTVRRAMIMAPSPEHWAQKIADEDRSVLQLAEQLARLFAIPDQPIIAHLPIVQRGDQRTVTFDPDAGEMVGLHVDSWDSDRLSGRETASNRIGINLGAEGRWFLFCPITVGTIAADLMPRSKRVLAGEGLPGVFFGESLECPVYRLLIDPGCAYIAPTENLIHDGSTEGSVVDGIAMSIRGRFEWRTVDWSSVLRNV